MNSSSRLPCPQPARPPSRVAFVADRHQGRADATSEPSRARAGVAGARCATVDAQSADKHVIFHGIYQASPIMSCIMCSALADENARGCAHRNHTTIARRPVSSAA